MLVSNASNKLPDSLDHIVIHEEKRPCRHESKCANCGLNGHVYKKCHVPITSYGIICVQHYYYNSSGAGGGDSTEIKRKFLMVRRKDSLSYVEFLRGKYSLHDREYILKLVSLMTFSEQSMLVQHTFPTLWRILWQMKDCGSGFKREYDQACLKFETLKKGFDFYDRKTQRQEHMSLCNIILEATCNGYGFEETEWGFAKGRRNIGESDIVCAQREFYEETGFPRSVALSIDEADVHEETFVGSNSMTYRHVYYIAHFYAPNLLWISERYHNREVGAVAWFTDAEVMDRIRHYNPERRQLFTRVVEQLDSSNMASLDFVAHDVLEHKDGDEDVAKRQGDAKHGDHDAGLLVDSGRVDADVGSRVSGVDVGSRVDADIGRVDVGRVDADIGRVVST